MTLLRHAAAALCLAAGLLALPAVAPAGEALSDTQMQAVDQRIHDYLMAHPEVIIESLQAYDQQRSQAEAAQQKQAIADLREELLHAPGDPVGGNPQAGFTVVEFFDYHCPYCKAVAADFLDAVKKDGNVRVVFKDFPILGDSSVFAAKAALAADKQGRYVAFYRAVMALKGDLSEEAVFRAAKAQGLDVERLKQDMAAPEIAQRISRNYDLARALGIHGTPAFIIGDELVPGALPMSELMAKVEQHRKG
ncbi:MAG: thioredoxin domain-containing protein [Rhodospirillaceae bacterium]|nr:thioredoxin domain-containing protein [Rhodospirillaceae bacterium]